MDEIIRKKLEEKIQGFEVIKAFRPSGQKEVLLIKAKEYDKVVLKLVKLTDDRIRREIDIMKSEAIDQIPTVLKWGSIDCGDETKDYILEEYIDGESLEEILEAGVLPQQEVLGLTRDLLSTVALLEEHRIVHRDIKPANIIRSSKGDFYLTDFGIARILDEPALTMTAAPYCPHTPGYGAPELFRPYDPQLIDSRADLFSIGVVIFEACVGCRLFIEYPGEAYEEIWDRVAELDPYVPSLNWDTSGIFVRFVRTLIQKHASMRPPSAAVALSLFTKILRDFQ